MASNTFDINLVVFNNYICTFLYWFQIYVCMFPQLCQNLDDLWLRYGDITIFFSKLRPYAMLDFRNWTFSSPNLGVRAVMPPNCKIRINRTRRSRVISNNDFQYGVRPPSWIWEFLIFCHVSIAWDKICVCVLSFVKFGWRYNYFQNGGRPPCWIFEIWHFHHLTFVRVRLCLLIPNFVLIGQYGAEL